MSSGSTKDRNMIALTTLRTEVYNPSLQAMHVMSPTQTLKQLPWYCNNAFCIVVELRNISTIKMHLGLHVKCPKFLYDFNQM
jgi:hypothetical protein